MSQPTLFVSGASGQLGRQVVERLLDGGHRVVAGTRTPEKLADLAARGAVVRRVDFNDDASLAAAFVGVDRTLIVSTDDFAVRGAHQVRAVDAAKAAGVRHLAYTSVVSPTSPRLIVAADHLGTERAIAERFASHTILRNNLYADLLIGALGPAVASGQLVTARGEGRIAYVRREDCAAAAAAALADGFEGARVLDITGPAAVSGDELAAIAAEISGRPVVHLSVPADAWVAGAVAGGLPAPIAHVLASFDAAAAAGDLASASGAVAALTGSSPASVAAFLAEHRAAWAG